MRGVPRARRDLARAVAVDLDAENARGSHDDRLEIGRLVVLEAGDEPEAIAQRAGDETGARGGAHQGEARKVEADRAGRRALPEHDVELEVFHRGIQHLLDGARQAVDLVDEQHVALVEVREHRGEIAGPFDGRAGRDVQAHAELGGDDVGQRGLAQAGRSGEQEVIGRLPSARGRLEDDRQVLSDLGLPDELGQVTRPQTDLVGDLFFAFDRFGAEELFAHGASA